MKQLFSLIKAKQRIIGLALISFLIFILGLTTGCSNIQLNLNSNNHETAINNASESDNANNLTTFAEVSAYIREHGKLPDNFITKKEAEALGWVPSEGNLHEVAPGKSIGGDRFGNREGLLPKKQGRIWYEADINYQGGKRNGDRIVFSNDGLIYMTTDHYQTFTDITEGMPE